MKPQCVSFAIAMLVLLLHGDSFAADAATFKVGGGGGWTIEARNWPNGKSFKAGDILEFEYNFEWVNVIIANKAEYEACKLPIRGGSAYQTGHDFITLKKGYNYFFSAGIVGQCQDGFKMIVFAD